MFMNNWQERYGQCQKIALSPEARAKLFLQEISNAAEPATYLEEVEIRKPGQVPVKPEVLKQFVEECDAVITGSGD